MPTPQIAALGECMIEFSPHLAGGREGDGLYRLGFGGDTLNTAVYLARLGIAVDYATALGDDGLSDRMIETWQGEGVGTGLVLRRPGRLPGLYLIHLDGAGERRFDYWRDRAPARELFELPETAALVERLSAYPMLYLSGISLSLYGDAGRAKLYALLDAVRARGGKVAFDANFRPKGWPDLGAARRTFAELYRRVDIACTGGEDEKTLFGDADAESTARRLAASGVTEIAVKNGKDGVLLFDGNRLHTVPVQGEVRQVDTTGAGDSFNAGYLAARLSGHGAEQAARWGHKVASAVIQHPGAIIPSEAMPRIEELP